MGSCWKGVGKAFSFPSVLFKLCNMDVQSHRLSIQEFFFLVPFLFLLWGNFVVLFLYPLSRPHISNGTSLRNMKGEQ